MGFFSKIKQAFGFGGSDFEDEEGILVDEGKPQDGIVTTASQADGKDAEAEYRKLAGEVPVDSIFNTVVKVFNESMPSFLGESTNVDAQKRYLYESLEADVKSYMDSIGVEATRMCEQRWEKERQALAEERGHLSEKLKEAEEHTAEKSRQLLSAERQKRAINERVHDLESQIARLEAEKEQYDLENRSLVNKLRVSNLINDGQEIPDVTSYETRIQNLNSQIEELNARIEEASAKHSEMQATIADMNAAIEEQKEIASRLEAEKKEALDSVKAMSVKTDMTDVMINDLNQRASSAAKELQSRDARIEELTAILSEKEAAMDALSSELKEAHGNLEIAAQIQSEVERISGIIETKNKLIADLNLDIRRKDERINALEAEEKSLRKTIESNILGQAESERVLREEISRLEKEATTSATKEKGRRRKSAPKISAIDEDLDNTDWLVATPPEGKSARTPGVPDSEFGYQEPRPQESSGELSPDVALVDTLRK